MEIYAATRPQDGHHENEDAFLIGRGEIPYPALCDGSGNAQRAARRALGLFERLYVEATPDDIARFQTWSGWTRLLDSALIGGAQSTFLAVATLGNRVVGACAGDSRLYWLGKDGDIRILTEASSKLRLGSGKVEPFAIHVPTKPGDTLLLMSDGAWTPLSLQTIQRVWARSETQHFSEYPPALLDEAGTHGRSDDMTVIALRF